jgi:hypothetical protein
VKQSGLFPGRFPAQVFLSGSVNADYFAVGDEQRNHDLEARFELRLLPFRVQAATSGRSGVHNFERYLRRQDNVEEPAIEPQGFIFLVLLEKPAALTELFVAELELIESLCITENLHVGLRVAVGDAAGFQWCHGHALVFGENAVNEAACREVAQAGVEFVSGLGGAAGVHFLDDMGGAFQHQNHLAFELGWQNRLHVDSLRRVPG